MKRAMLIRLAPADEHAIGSNPRFAAALAGDDWEALADLVHETIGHTLAVPPAAVNELHWGGYVAIDEETRQVVGSCAFKAPPTNEGEVEIAYLTYPTFEGQGYATAMATKLVELANGSPLVQEVIAHTLPERNASTRVLEKLGMQLIGEVVDPDDGRVWRWRALTRTSPRCSR